MNARQLGLIKSITPLPMRKVMRKLMYRYMVWDHERTERRNQCLVDWCYAKQQASALYMTRRITSEEYDALTNYADRVFKHRKRHGWKDS